MIKPLKKYRIHLKPTSHLSELLVCMKKISKPTNQIQASNTQWTKNIRSIKKLRPSQREFCSNVYIKNLNLCEILMLSQPHKSDNNKNHNKSKNYLSHSDKT